MSRIFLVFSLFLISLSKTALAYDYDPLLMRAQASIFPKIILLDKELDRKVMLDQIVIHVVYGRHEKNVAMDIKALIQNQYENNLGKRRLKVDLISFDMFHESDVATAYFILKGARDQRDQVTEFAAKQQRLVFSYDYKDFESNALVSVLMKEKTYIYLNKSAIHDYGIKFLPLFYKIVKVIE